MGSALTFSITPINMSEEEGRWLKKQVFELAKAQFATRLSGLRTAITEAQQAANAEGKSSMGDKYETARSMAQLDTEMLGSQLIEVEKSLRGLERLSEESATRLSAGSLARFSSGWHWIAPGGGKLLVQSQSIYWISPHSPWAKQMLGMQVGEVRSFNQKTWRLEALF